MLTVVKLEEPMLRVMEIRMLRRMFRSKTDDVIGGLRKLHNEAFHDL
jgi:hypothetical protein